jgi:hypothetical protein
MDPNFYVKHSGDSIKEDGSNLEYVSEACEKYRGDAGDAYDTLSGGDGSGKNYSGSDSTASDLFDVLSS